MRPTPATTPRIAPSIAHRLLNPDQFGDLQIRVSLDDSTVSFVTSEPFDVGAPITIKCDGVQFSGIVTMIETDTRYGHTLHHVYALDDVSFMARRHGQKAG